MTLQLGGLSGFLGAGWPGGAPEGYPHACYYEGGCAQARSHQTAKSCDLLRGGKNHAYYWVPNHQCLPKDEYALLVQRVADDNCGLFSTQNSCRQKCKSECKSELEKTLREDPCLPGYFRPSFISVQSTHAESYYPQWNWKDACRATCTVLDYCFKLPTETEAPVSVPDVYVSISDAKPQVGAGFSKSIFTLRVHDQDNRPMPIHGGLTVKYHTEQIKDPTILGEDAALEGKDYEGVNTSVAIPDGTFLKTVSVKILDDDEPENIEAFMVKLDGVTKGRGQIDRPIGYGTITDNDGASPTPTPTEEPEESAFPEPTSTANPTLEVVNEAPSLGTVTTSDGYIDCGQSCSTTSYEEGAEVTLTADANDGYAASMWTNVKNCLGCSTLVGETCMVLLPPDGAMCGILWKEI